MYIRPWGLMINVYLLLLFSDLITIYYLFIYLFISYLLLEQQASETDGN